MVMSRQSSTKSLRYQSAVDKGNEVRFRSTHSLIHSLTQSINQLTPKLLFMLFMHTLHANAQALTNILDFESQRVPWPFVGPLIIFQLAIVALYVAKELAACGSPGFWVATASFVPLSLAFMVLASYQLLRLQRQRDVCGYEYVKGDVQWDFNSTNYYHLLNTGAGVIASWFGLGGGIGERSARRPSDQSWSPPCHSDRLTRNHAIRCDTRACACVRACVCGRSEGSDHVRDGDTPGGGRGNELSNDGVHDVLLQRILRGDPRGAGMVCHGNVRHERGVLRRRSVPSEKVD